MNRLQLARRPRPLGCNVIGPGTSPPTAPGRGHYSEPQVGPNGCQSLKGPKAHGAERLGNWSTLTHKLRPVAGGSWSGRRAERPRTWVKHPKQSSRRDRRAKLGATGTGVLWEAVGLILLLTAPGSRRFSSVVSHRGKLKEKNSPLSSLLCHNLSVTNFENALLFQSQYSESCDTCASGFECCRHCPSDTSAVPRQREKNAVPH